MQLAFELEIPEVKVPNPGSRTAFQMLKAKSIVRKATGMVSAYDWTINPYSGCQFACSYCYAAHFVPDELRREQWGDWVDIKENALGLLRVARGLAGSHIYLGSVTDPYQPVEKQVRLTRQILSHLARLSPQPKIVVQTRSPLVVSDIPLLKEFGRNVRVNFSITTDDEDVRKAFEPRTARIAQRLDAVKSLVDAGIDVCVCVSPMLPIVDPEDFGRRLRETGARRFTASAFHRGKVPFRSGTREKALAIAKEMGWGGPEYVETVLRLRSVLPELETKGAGFMPVSAKGA